MSRSNKDNKWAHEEEDRPSVPRKKSHGRIGKNISDATLHKLEHSRNSLARKQVEQAAKFNKYRNV